MTKNNKTSLPSTTSPSTTSGRITCHYINKTRKLQIIRISNIEGWYFERVIFAGQPLLLEVNADAVLEIHTYEMATAILADRIPCWQLRYAEPIEHPPTPHNVSDQASRMASSHMAAA